MARIPVAGKKLSDPDFRLRVVLVSSIAVNVWFVATEIVNGVLQGSLWAISLGTYYALLIGTKTYLLVRGRNIYSRKKQILTAKVTGIILLVLNLALIVMFVQMVTENAAPPYGSYFVTAIALYTIYRVISAVVSAVRFRKYDKPVWSAIKVMNLVASLVALLMMQRVIIVSLVGETELARILNSAGGIAIFATVLWLAVSLIRGERWKERPKKIASQC